MKLRFFMYSFVLFLLVGCTERNDWPTEVEVIKEQPAVTVDLAMIGDVLLHKRIAQYEDFNPSFEPMKDILSSYDYLIANQESAPIANEFGIIGYPRFSSPPHILNTLQYVGVDMLNLANNHTVDWGQPGIRTLFENVEAANFPYIGAYQSDEDRYTPRIVDIDGVLIGMLGYTYGTNGFYLPENSSYSVNYIEDAKIIRDIENLKSLVDVVAVSMHWGPEYVTTENEEQRRLASLLNDAGADVVFGSHPHILQPYTKLTNDKGQETHVFYSIGNFFATITSVPDTFIGGAASVSITKQGQDVTVSNPTFTASTMIMEGDRYVIYPLAHVQERAVRDLTWVQEVLGPDVTIR